MGAKPPKKRLEPPKFTRLYIRSQPRSIRPFFKLGDSTSGLKLSIHIVYQGLNPVHLARSCQLYLATVKVTGSPAEPGRAKSPWNWSETPLITIINQPPPPIVLPWSIRNCSHHAANSILIDFAFLRGRVRPLVQKLRTTDNLSGALLKLYFGVFLVFPKCISVFPTTCEDLAQSFDSTCHIGKGIWKSVSPVMVWGKVSIPTYQTVFGSYLGCISCILEPYFCMSDLTGGPGSI